MARDLIAVWLAVDLASFAIRLTVEFDPAAQSLADTVPADGAVVTDDHAREV